MARVLLLLAVLLAGPIAARGQRPEPPIPADVEWIRDVDFGTGGGRALRMHILRPKPLPEKPLPAVVWVHGGGWRQGSRDDGLRRLARLAERGYLGASIEYRLSQEATFPAQIEDCKCAVRFLRAKAKDYHLDPDHIGAWGASAGGHLVALLGTAGDVKELEGRGGWPDQSSRVQAVCDGFGPTDFLKMDEAGSLLRHNTPRSPESLLIGGLITQHPDKVARANPITYVTKDDPPFLILHGDKDDLVPLDQSQRLQQALKQAGVPATLHVVKGAGHGFGGPEIDKMIDAFFDEHLRGIKPTEDKK
jgi:acetyl esterase/lipase